MLPLALDGIRVLEVGHIMAAPFCGLLLADMGADVIKVEPPGSGDAMRRMGPPFFNHEAGAFLIMNRNKRSITLNLKSSEGRELFRRLAEEADVLVENYRPGAMEKLGLGYDELKLLNPGLIYCSITGFGRTGPYASRGGFDLIAQGMSGLMTTTGHPGDPPTKVGVPICDLNAGLYAAYGVLAAYIRRSRTGRGQYLDIALLDAGLSYIFWEASEYFGGKFPEPTGSAHRSIAPYQAFRVRNGFINVGAGTQVNWERFCHVIDREDLLKDRKFRTNSDRIKRRDELAETLEKTLEEQDAEYWLDRLEAAGVPAGPIYTVPQVFEDPQVLSRDMLVEIDHPTAGRVKNIGTPLKLSETPACVRRPAPTLGQHTHEVLQELGLNDGQITRLREVGATG
jgi:crotonobetainyl-CoA:carnitine CoA-transferase CaiB-like acyl-CoA transferase